MHDAHSDECKYAACTARVLSSMLTILMRLRRWPTPGWASSRSTTAPCPATSSPPTTWAPSAGRRAGPAPATVSGPAAPATSMPLTTPHASRCHHACTCPNGNSLLSAGPGAGPAPAAVSAQQHQPHALLLRYHAPLLASCMDLAAHATTRLPTASCCLAGILRASASTCNRNFTSLLTACRVLMQSGADKMPNGIPDDQLEFTQPPPSAIAPFNSSSAGAIPAANSTSRPRPAANATAATPPGEQLTPHCH